MKTTIYLVFLVDGQDIANRVSGSVYSSVAELKGSLGSDGIRYLGIQPIHEFEQDWNDTDEETKTGVEVSLLTTFIAHVFITERI